MKVVKRSEIKTYKNSDVCIVNDYHLNDKDIGWAIAHISGRYPDKGYVMNRKCKELGYVLKGRGKLVSSGKTIRLKVGDMVLIQPREKYYWEGNMSIIVPTTPAWYPKQHVNVI